MSEEALQDLMSRIAGDPEFADSVRNNPVTALGSWDLSTVELLALSCADEDALRRLLGSYEDAPVVEMSVFRDVARPYFDEAAREELVDVAGEAAAGGKTSKETSHTVTKCCWP